MTTDTTPAAATDKPRYYTAKETAEILRCALSFVRKEIAAGHLKAALIARSYLITEEDIEDYVKSRRQVKAGE